MVPITQSPNVKTLKSGLSMLLEPGAPISIPLKKNLFTKSDDDFAASYGSVESFSESFFESPKKRVPLGASENTASESSFFNSLEILSIKEDHSEPVTPIPSSDQKPPKFGVSDLLTLLLDDIRLLEKDKSDQSLEELDMIHGLAQITSDDMLAALLVLPAEEDGTAMDDLPSFSTKTELLSLGVKDFAVVDKASYESLMHVRAEGNVEMIGRLQRATSQVSTQDSNESSYYGDRPSSFTNADTVQVFRMDSDDSLLRDTVNKLIKSDSLREVPPESLTPIMKPPDVSGSLLQTGTTPTTGRVSRRRSFSFCFTVSYRFSGSEKWRFVKKAFINPLVTPITTPKLLKVTKSNFIPITTSNDDEIKKQDHKNNNNLQQPHQQQRERTKIVEAISINYSQKKNIPLPQPLILTPNLSTSTKIPTLQTLTDSGLFRRHSEKTYQEEMILKRKQNQDEKYSRNYSFSGEGMLSLNPHTSSSIKAQFSPSTHSSNPSREDSPIEFENYYIPPLSNKYSSPTHRTQSPGINQAINTITPFSSPSRSKKELIPLNMTTGPSPSPMSNKSSQGVTTPSGSSRTSVGGNTSSNSSILNIFRLF